MNSYWPGMLSEPNPDFRLVVNLEEVLGSFNNDLGDPKYDHLATQFAGDTGGYICRGLIHNLMRIPGGLTVEECVRFFPVDMHKEAKYFLDHFWQALAGDVSRMEAMVRASNPNRPFQANTQPSPLVSGYQTLTIWYHWMTPQELQGQETELEPEEPALLGF